MGAALRPIAGEAVCGDSFAVVHVAGGTLICLADGLGHGAPANEASSAACRYAMDHAGAPLDALMRGIDVALRALRGAAVSLLSIEPGRALFAGVGNVDIRACARASIAPPLRPGIVGQGVSGVRVWEYPLTNGDLMVLASDGISSRFDLGTMIHLAPQALADHLLERHSKGSDDACCVVARVGSAKGSKAGAVRGGDT